MQISNKAAHYPRVARIRDLESQPGDPDHKKKNSVVRYIIAELSWNFQQNLLIIYSGQLGSQHGDPDRYQNLITCSFYHPGPLHKISAQCIDNFLSNVANRQTDKQKHKQFNAAENTISLSLVIKWSRSN